MSTLEGKVVLLLGASRGIGAESARAIAGLGGRQMIASRRPDACRELAASLPGQAEAIGCDVADYSAVVDAVQATLDKFGKLDILVNCAGVISPIARLEDSDPEAFAETVQINFLGVYHGIRAVLPVFRKNGGGSIVNVSSGAAEVPIEGWSHYCAAKAAVAMLTRCVDSELRGANVLCFGLQPGIADTEMQVEIRASGINELSKRPREQLPPPSEAGHLIAWVCETLPEDLAGREFSIDDPELRRRAGLPERQ